MKPECAYEPQVWERATAEAAPEWAFLEAHLQSCARCRAVEQRRLLMRESFQRRPQSQAEILQLRLRLLPAVRARLAPRASLRLRRPAALVPVLVFLALSSAATAAVVTEAVPRLIQWTSAWVKRAEPAAATSASEQPALASQRATGLPRPSATSASEVAPADDVEAAVTAPSVSETPARRDMPRAMAQATASVAADPGAATPLEPHWAEAAAALKRNDFVSAERALEELGTGSAGATRDTALLSLAQLRMKQGKLQAARQMLQGLAKEGSTPFVRERAGQLLRDASTR